MQNTENIERLKEIRDEMTNLATEAESLLPIHGSIRLRANSFWLTHLRLALGSDDKPTETSPTIETTITELEAIEIRREVLK